MLDARVDAQLLADLAEPRVAVPVVAEVEVEEVADAEVVVREARLGAGDRPVRVGVAGDEDVGPAVAVDVGDGDARVPAVGGDPGGPRALAEVAVAVVPENASYPAPVT